MKKGRIIVFSGPSGVGKGTVLQEVMRRRPELRFSVSATTRPIRPSETDGVNYYFISKEAFESMIADHSMLEHVTYAGNYYGTPEKPLEEAMEQGLSVVLEIEVQGALQVFANRDDTISIFVAPPSFAELERRLRGRGDTAPEVVEERLRIARWECAQASKYKYIVINDTVERAAAEVEAILTAEACRSEYQESILPKEEN